MGREVTTGMAGMPMLPATETAVSTKVRPKSAKVISPMGKTLSQVRVVRGQEPLHVALVGAELPRRCLDPVEALVLDRPLLCGFDWGGRAACAAAALWPERFSALVAIGGYSIYDVAHSLDPAPADVEHVLWYQYYFHGERGARGLAADRQGLCRLLWSLWSPGKPLDAAAFARTAPSLDDADFVAVTLSSYRHRFGLAAGDPAYAVSQTRLAVLPPVTVPSLVLNGIGGPLPAGTSPDRSRLPALLDWRMVEGAGHNVPHEAPDAVAAAILELEYGLGATA